VAAAEAVLAAHGIKRIEPGSDEASDPENPWGRGFDVGWNHCLNRVLEALALGDPAATDTTPSKSRQTVNSASSRTRVAVRGTTEPEEQS